jgi:hypothetical protein
LFYFIFFEYQKQRGILMKTQSKGIIRKHPKTAIAIAAGALAVGATALALWRRNHGGKQMAKASRGGRMTAAKKRAS